MSKVCPDCQQPTDERKLPNAQWIRYECSRCGWYNYGEME